jgi:hypothetical protein
MRYPLDKFIEQIEVPDPEPTPVDTGLEKLKALGLTEEEITALLGR